MASTGSISEEVRYVLTMFGAQTPLNIPRKSHTFAVFSGADPSGAHITRVISWLPASGVIHPGMVQKGKNYTLEETLAWAKDKGARVYSTQATAVAPDLYRSAGERVRELESGTVAYTMLDRFSTRPHEITNCIHAVSDLPVVLKSQPLLDTGLLRGFPASMAVYTPPGPE